jgi:hypothetical protein
MKTIDLNATNTTPAVHYGLDNKLEIKGRSIPEDVVKFYQPLFEWAASLEVSSLTVVINLEYVNSASAKKLLYLLKVLDANNHIKELYINWYYEKGDEHALEDGQVFEEFLMKARFTYHEYADAA